MSQAPVLQRLYVGCMTKGEVKRIVAGVIERAGLHTGAGGSTEPIRLVLSAGGVESIIVYYRGDATLESLQDISDGLGTGRIDLGVQIQGLPEDLAVSPYLKIHSPSIPGVEGPIER